MTNSLNAVEAAALELPEAERAELIERLVESMLPSPTLHPAWAGEIERRIAEMDNGGTEAIPAEQVFAEMRAMIEAYKPKS